MIGECLLYIALDNSVTAAFLQVGELLIPGAEKL
jgi:hypothetical protein